MIMDLKEIVVMWIVLLDSSRLRWLPGKLKSKWTDPYLITQVFPHGEVKFKAKEGMQFQRNRDWMKLYFKHKASGNEVIEAYHLDEVWVIKGPQPCRDIKSGACWEETQYL